MAARPTPEPGQRSCRCESAIPSVIMDGFACGAPDCWRTAEAAASFAAFVADLKRERAGGAVASGDDRAG